MSLSPRILTFVAIVPILVAIDLGVKEWAHLAIESGRYIRLWTGFGLTHGFNPGISFSLLDDFPQGVVVMTGVLTTGMLAWLATTRDRKLILPLGFISAGAVANFIDRINHGAVTDIFVIGAPQAPLFTNNLADFWITFGVVTMVLQSVNIGRRTASGSVR